MKDTCLILIVIAAIFAVVPSCAKFEPVAPAEK
jgi:hypothetical protein